MPEEVVGLEIGGEQAHGADVPSIVGEACTQCSEKAFSKKFKHMSEGHSLTARSYLESVQDCQRSSAEQGRTERFYGPEAIQTLQSEFDAGTWTSDLFAQLETESQQDVLPLRISGPKQLLNHQKESELETDSLQLQPSWKLNLMGRAAAAFSRTPSLCSLMQEMNWCMKKIEPPCTSFEFG